MCKIRAPTPAQDSVWDFYDTRRAPPGILPCFSLTNQLAYSFAYIINESTNLLLVVFQHTVFKNTFMLARLHTLLPLTSLSLGRDWESGPWPFLPSGNSPDPELLCWGGKRVHFCEWQPHFRSWDSVDHETAAAISSTCLLGGGTSRPWDGEGAVRALGIPSYAIPKRKCHLLRGLWAEDGSPQPRAVALTENLTLAAGSWGRLRTADIMPFPRRYPSD